MSGGAVTRTLLPAADEHAMKPTNTAPSPGEGGCKARHQMQTPRKQRDSHAAPMCRTQFEPSRRRCCWWRRRLLHHSLPPPLPAAALLCRAFASLHGQPTSQHQKEEAAAARQSASRPAAIEDKRKGCAAVPQLPARHPHQMPLLT